MTSTTKTPPKTTRRKTPVTKAASKTTTRKTPAVRKATSRSTATSTTPVEAPVVEPVVTEQPEPQENVMTEVALTTQDDLRKKELIDLVVERSGVKKRDAKPAIEAALAILGEAIGDGRELNLQPLGKLKVTRIKEGEGIKVVNTRLRQSTRQSSETPDTPAVQAAE
jgi:DNA-binding protein HU-alpha